MRYPTKIKTKQSVCAYPFPLRNHDELIEDAKKAEESKIFVRGVRGESVISKNVTSFDMIWGFPIDYMHGIILGVTKQLWEEWTNSQSNFHLNPQQRKLIDDRLLRIKPTKEIYRLPEELKRKSKWKASTWLYWCLFYSIHCLSGILHEEAVNSYALLVKSINTLL